MEQNSYGKGIVQDIFDEGLGGGLEIVCGHKYDNGDGCDQGNEYGWGDGIRGGHGDGDIEMEGHGFGKYIITK